MNINNLKLKIYKGYKELCDVLEESVKGGKSKQLQIKNWKRYFKWIEHTRYKWEITEIYDTPKEKEDGRGGASNNIFTDHIDYIVLNEIKNNYIGIKGTFRQLAERFGLVSAVWGDIVKDVDKFASTLGINSKILSEFYFITREQLKRIIFGSFERLKNESVIVYNVYACAKHANGDSRVLDIGEKEQYDIIENEVIFSMGYVDKFKIMYDGVWDEFKERLREETIDKMRIRYVYDEIVVVSTEMDRLESRMKEIEEKYGNIDHYIVLRKKISKSIINNAIRRYEEAKEKVGGADIEYIDWEVGDKIRRRANREYMEAYRKCVEYFIRVAE